MLLIIKSDIEMETHQNIVNAFQDLPVFQVGGQSPLTEFRRNLEYVINSDGALAVVLRNWLSNANDLCEQLIEEITWIQGQMNIFGKIINIPRSMFFLGDDNV